MAEIELDNIDELQEQQEAVLQTDETPQSPLSPEDQGKDWLPFNSMLKLLRKYDGLRIYQLGKD